jgi:murein DD-endopeptidase MepM/ murein hydrolase activator NlpD
VRARDHDATLLGVVGVAGGGLLLWSLLRNRTSLELQPTAPAREQASAPSTARPAERGWQWPVPMWREYSPAVSDGWGTQRTTLDGTPIVHRGVDLMYPRKSLDDQAEAFPPGTAGGSKWHFVPMAIPVLAARKGRVVFARRGPRGHAVTIRHPDGWTTFYQHLASLGVRVGDHVDAGDVLGELGGDPTQKPALRHLHFELRDPHGVAIDPKPHLLTWPRARALAVADGASASVLLPPPKAA